MVQDSSKRLSSRQLSSRQHSPEPLAPARFVELPALALVGMRQQTSLADNRMLQLWQQFRPRCKEIPRADLSRFYNLKHFGKGMDWNAFSPQTLFEHWAAVAVSGDKALINGTGKAPGYASHKNPGRESGKGSGTRGLPVGMDTFELESGLYAVFVYQGLASGFSDALNAIFGQWLPGTDYQLDDRPHFEVLSEHYRPDDPNASEEIWVPIAPRF